jgi:N-acetyl-gamma-glutamyl-phosphate reductase
VSVTFVPHLVPVDQGELMSCYVTATEAVDEARVRALYDEAYAAEPFVEIVDAPPGMRDVRETNRCHINVGVDRGNGRVMVFAAIDNLWKGTSSQAIQNLNLMLGLPEDEGLGA